MKNEQIDSNESITFIIAVNDKHVYERNFLHSPMLNEIKKKEIFPMENFRSAARAYNEGIEASNSDIIVFNHQDIIFPKLWIQDLIKSLDYLSKNDPSWGVLGCFGVSKEGCFIGHVYDSAQGEILGSPFSGLIEVQTLDEIVLVTRKSSGLRFDESLPYFHLYGTEICLCATQRGMKSYAMSAFCIHNTNQIISYPDEFYRAYFHIKARYRQFLPIYTSCIKISKFDIDIYKRKLKEAWKRLLGRHKKRYFRASDPAMLMKHFKSF
jgi:hypothetical protein